MPYSSAPPARWARGVLILPTVHGNLLVGPDSEDIDDKSNFDTSRDRLAYVREAAAKHPTAFLWAMHHSIYGIKGYTGWR